MTRQANRYFGWRRASAALAVAASMALSSGALAQTGVDDDRVSLPEGPGSIEGVGENVEIDPNMGSMSYGVQIPVPGGLAGLTPAVGLNYSSAGGSSVVGVGWSMPTMSIERMTSRGTPEYDAEDLFAVDGGDELVLVSSGGGEQVYRARFEGGFVRYTWKGVGDGEEGYWTAEYPDGSIGYFGADASGELVTSARSTKPGGGVYKYHLVEKVDPYGHRLAYTYTTLGGNWPLVSSIGYVFEGSTPLYEVRYSYEGREDQISDAGAGYEELLEYRLAGVQVTVRGEILREVELGYEDYDTSGGFTRLTSVRRYGIGGKDGGELYPIAFTFDYSTALGAECGGGAGCDDPYLVNMGSAPGAAGLAAGSSTLVDINSDGLPDIVDTSEAGAHRISFNTLSIESDGSTSHIFGAATASATGTGTDFGLANEGAQVIDVNGDGLSDLVNPTSGSTLMAGYGVTDWVGNGSPLDTSVLRNIDIPSARFLDYNNDKLIDLITSTGDATTVYENLGDSFRVRNIESLGVTLASNQFVQLADMNGDGYNDVVEINSSNGSLRYRLNYGWGEFSEWNNVTGISVNTGEVDLVDLEDLNGDGISDVVVVTANEVSYAINRNGNTFDPFVDITSADIAGDLPERGDGDKVLYADMNANGSEDVVWFDASGEVKYLELFPVCPNLLTRIDNGIGMVQKIEYDSAAMQEAAARAAGDPWTSTLSIPMNVVAKTDMFVTLTGEEDGSGLHDVVTYTYRDGFYDGVEKQYRGFENVRVEVQSSEAQEGGVTTMVYDVGREKPHFNGLMISSESSSGGDPLDALVNTYEECDLDGVPTPAELTAQGRFAVYFPCLVESNTTLKERTSEAEWITLGSRSTFDGWGNVTKSEQLGDVLVDGDELYSETEYYYPGEGDRWFVGLPLVTRTWAIADGSVKTESKTYYDGDDFVGAQSGLTHGFVSRMTEKVDDTKVIESLRARRDEHGNVVETISPRGSLSDADAHRREYVYDSTGLFLTNMDVKIASGHVLRRATQYNYTFQKMTDVTDWVTLVDGQEVTARNAKAYEYDDFGRIVREFEPGDEPDTPSLEYVYELGEPFSTIRYLGREVTNGPQNTETVQCFDGRGRNYQTRTETDSGDWLVTGFNVFNSRGAVVETFQSYSSPSSECEDSRPSGVLSTRKVYDAQYRVLETIESGEEIYGEELRKGTVYLPLREENYDFEDNDPNSVHYDTPTIRYRDGVGRLVAIERRLAGGDSATYALHYDETSSFAGYTDPGGNRHSLSVDLAGRITSVTNPTTGTTNFEYDDSNNVVATTDARGVTARMAYDGGDRLVARWNDADEGGTKVSFHYDTVPDGCPITECTNPANRVVTTSYPTPFGPATDRIGYDNRARIVFKGRSVGEAVDMSVKTTFNNLDRPIAHEYSDGTILTMTHEPNGRVVGIDGFIEKLGYSERGLLTSVDYANGARSELVYDSLVRLESRVNKDASGSIIEGFMAERDRMGHLTKLEDLGESEGPGHQASFSYDAWYRVTSATQEVDGSDETISYAFDELDRITSIRSDLEAASAAHVGDIAYDSERPLAVETAGTMTYGFDAAGQVVMRGDLELAWDHMGRITSATRGDDVQTHVYGSDKARVAIIDEDATVFYGFGEQEIRDGVSSVYVRPMGERLARSVSTAQMTQMFSDADSDGTLTALDVFIAGDDQGALTGAQALGAVAARMLADAGGDKVFLHSDNLGSIVSATDSAGEVVGRRAYNMTGGLRYEFGHVDVYGFTGQELNEFTGLIQFAMRDFDPLLGRWASFDPAFVLLDAAAMASLGEATTGYAYVSNSFANFVDPLGLEKDPPAKGGGGGGGAAAAGGGDSKKKGRSDSVNDMLKSSGTPAGPSDKVSSDQEMAAVVGDMEFNQALTMSSQQNQMSATPGAPTAPPMADDTVNKSVAQSAPKRGNASMANKKNQLAGGGGATEKKGSGIGSPTLVASTGALGAYGNKTVALKKQGAADIKVTVVAKEKKGLSQDAKKDIKGVIAVLGGLTTVWAVLEGLDIGPTEAGIYSFGI